MLLESVFGAGRNGHLAARQEEEKTYFTSSYPHHDIYTFCYWQNFWHSIWHIFWHFIWHIFWHSIWHIFWHSTWHIFCNMFWHIFWRSIWHIFWQIFWHSIWHSIWKIFWHMFWQTFWDFIWHTFWHSIWHSILSGISSGILSGIPSGILSGISSGILSGKHSILALYLAYLLAFLLLAFYLAVEVQRCSLSSEGPRLRSSGAHWARTVPGWGPAVLTELGRSQVEVQRCPVRSGPCAHCVRELAKSLAKSWQGGSEHGSGGRGGGGIPWPSQGLVRWQSCWWMVQMYLAAFWHSADWSLWCCDPKSSLKHYHCETSDRSWQSLCLRAQEWYWWHRCSTLDSQRGWASQDSCSLAQRVSGQQLCSWVWGLPGFGSKRPQICKFAPEHIKEARQALDPGRFAPENVSLVPTSAWIVDGLPPGTDREQVRSLLAAWQWNVIPSQPNKQSWIVLSDSPPPASRCYASCGPLLIRPQVAPSVAVRSMTSSASKAVISQHTASISAPPVVPSPIPLALKEEVSKAVAQSQTHVEEEVSQLRAEMAEMKAKLGADLGAMDTKWTSAHDNVTKKVDAIAFQLQDLRTDLSKIDIHSAVTQALASALPSALSAALPSALSDSSTVPSPLRKDRKIWLSSGLLLTSVWCAWHGTCSSVLDLLCLFFGVILSFVHGIWASVCFSVDSVQSVSQLVFLHAQHRLVYLHCASPWHWPWFMCLALHIVLLAPSAFGLLDCVSVPCSAGRSPCFVAAPSRGLCGGAPSSSVDFSTLVEASADPAPDLSFVPLPNLGNTCWLASLTRLLHTCDLRLPCAMPSWRETVDRISALGFHDGHQKDPRLVLSAICALFPQWTAEHLWTFNRNASCSVCQSVIPPVFLILSLLCPLLWMRTWTVWLVVACNIFWILLTSLLCSSTFGVLWMASSLAPSFVCPIVFLGSVAPISSLLQLFTLALVILWLFCLLRPLIWVGLILMTAGNTCWLLRSIGIGIYNRMLPCLPTSSFLSVLLRLVTLSWLLILVTRLPPVLCSLWLPISLAGLLVGLRSWMIILPLVRVSGCSRRLTFPALRRAPVSVVFIALGSTGPSRACGPAVCGPEGLQVSILSCICSRILSGICVWHFFLVFILAFQQSFSHISWRKLTLSDPRVLSGISFGILSGITSDNSCCHAIWHLFWNSFWHTRLLCTVSSHIHCGILSHPGACDPRTRRRRGVADIESNNPEHAGEGTTLTKWKHMEVQAAQSLSTMVFYSIKGHGHAAWSSKGSNNVGT